VWSDQSREFWPVVMFREAEWPCAIDFRKVIDWLAHLLQRKYSFITYNKNSEARCKKYLLVVKKTISICVNRKLLRKKSTTKQKNNRSLKRTVFSHLYVRTVASGVCNTPTLNMHYVCVSKRGLRHNTLTATIFGTWLPELFLIWWFVVGAL